METLRHGNFCLGSRRNLGRLPVLRSQVLRYRAAAPRPASSPSSFRTSARRLTRPIPSGSHPRARARSGIVSAPDGDLAESDFRHTGAGPRQLHGRTSRNSCAASLSRAMRTKCSSRMRPKPAALPLRRHAQIQQVRLAHADHEHAVAGQHCRPIPSPSSYSRRSANRRSCPASTDGYRWPARSASPDRGRRRAWAGTSAGCRVGRSSLFVHFKRDLVAHIKRHRLLRGQSAAGLSTTGSASRAIERACG